MRCPAALLMTSLMSLSGCTFVFSSQDGSGGAKSDGGNDDDAGASADCQGLSLLQLNQDTRINAGQWWGDSANGAGFSRSEGALLLSTGDSTDQRIVTLGTNDYYGMAGTFSLQVLDLDLQNAPLATFYLGLDSDSMPSDTREIAMSISFGTLSFFGDGDGAGYSGATPSTPF